jgi:hypothetical protein
MYRSLTAPVVAIALLLGGSAGARADLVPPSQLRWQYNFSPTMSPPAVFATNPGASVSFTNEPNRWATGNSTDLVATNLNLSSVAPFEHPDTIVNGNYGLSLKLWVPDQIGHGPPLTNAVPLNFSGQLSGTFSEESANVANTFTDAGPKTLYLGGYKFVVELNHYAPPGPPNQVVVKGSITAHVTVSLDDRNPNPNPQETPEPASFLLCSLGAALGGFAWWRRRKPPEA